MICKTLVQRGLAEYPTLEHVKWLIPIVFPCLVVFACGEAPPPPTVSGLALVAHANCLACHQVAGQSQPADLITDRMPGPLLDDVGARLSPKYLYDFLVNPSAVKPGTPMPNVLHGMNVQVLHSTAGDLVQYLVSCGGPIPSESTEVDPYMLAEGQLLYETIGCVACHGPEIDAERLARQTTHQGLADFLEDPNHVRPGGRMPDMNLRPSEAAAIAAYLLREQASDELSPQSGLRWYAYEGHFDDGPLNLDEMEPVDGGLAEIMTEDPATREDYFALRFEGSIEIPRNGVYTFATESDDGSWLWIDGKLIVDNGGIHGMAWQEAEVELEKGFHEIRVEMFEAGGGQGLDVFWSGPGVEEQLLEGDVLSHLGTSLMPPPGMIELDPDRIARGRQYFVSLGCAQCHEPDNAADLAYRKVTTWQDLPASITGCLAPDPPANLPAYTFTDEARQAVLGVLAARGSLKDGISPSIEAAWRMAALNCAACHIRDGIPQQPTPEAMLAFVSSVELGDEGRVPPNLTEVGHKLEQDWIEHVLYTGEKVRPGMTTRMPIYAHEQIKHLPGLLAAADSKPQDTKEPVFDLEDIEIGRTLVGTSGLSCMTCHDVAGHAATGVSSVDLAKIHGRIKPAWFQDFMMNPMAKNPQTRMPRYFSKDEIIFPHLAEGKPARQIDAIWNYCSLGSSMPLPEGLNIDRSEFDIVPIDEPRVIGVFMDAVSPRTLAVGFPEKLHLAFDAQSARLAQIWRGEFINTQGTWDGRAGELEFPAGDDVKQMPSGPALARLETVDAPWPTDDRGDWQMASIMYDAKRRPSFLYKLDQMTAKESPVPAVHRGGPRLLRTFEVYSSEAEENVYLRAAVAKEITAQSPIAFQVNDDHWVFLQGAEGMIREDGQEKELLIPLTFLHVGGDEIEAYRATVTLEMKW